VRHGRQVRDLQGRGKTGGYRWRLKSRNGEIVASGESYETKAGAKKGVQAVQRELPPEPRLRT
jgi:uncharacterized protein YegP (UPF0339 family)